MRYSKQREAVYNVLCSTKTHPDAAYVYNQVRKVIPNISLGTVYRNLNELCQMGQIKKISVQNSAERYDAFLQPHAHFICTICGEVSDVDMDEISLHHNIDGVEQCELYLYGACQKCKNAN